MRNVAHTMDRRRRYAGLGVAVVLIITGTLGTGFLPSTPLYQVIAGGLIVAGFAVGYASLGAFEFLE